MLTNLRDIMSARSWAGAMGGIKSKCDSFTCPETPNDWHRQVLSLHQRIETEPSAKISAILEQEIKEILETKIATKRV